MQEILFKAKRKDWRNLPKGEWWVEGYYVKYQPCASISEYVHGIVPAYASALYIIEIDPTTLCQYTGLTDKNGRKVWENDILRGHRNVNDLARVVFGEFNVIDVETLEVVDSVIGWHTKVIETDALSKCEPFCLPMPLTDFYINRSEYEVVGNFSDNSDLLEVE